MSKKNIFLLALGYITGSAVALLYGKKKTSTSKSATGKIDFKKLVDDFVEVHSNLIDDLKKEILTPENKKLFNEKKDELLRILNSYKVRGNALLRELERKGKTYLAEASKKLESLYREKQSEISALKDIAPEKIEELKVKLKGAFEHIKEEMRNLAK